MDYVRLGHTGLKVSRICLGCMTYGSPKWRDWILDEAASRPFFKQALDLGINFFDTADVYSLGASEEVTGRALKEMAKRDQVVIATKVCSPMGKGANDRGLSRKHIMESIDASLKRLGTDYVDLYQIHRWDYDTPIEETIEALNDVVKAGKALYIGASSMFAWQFMKALGHQRANGLAPFVSMQNHYNLVYREEEREMMPLCVSEGIGVIPWSPIARGFLTGNRKPGDNPKKAGGAPAQRRNLARRQRRIRAHALLHRARFSDRRARRRRSPRSTADRTRKWRWPGYSQSPASPRRSSAPRNPATSKTRSPPSALKLDAEDIKTLEEPYKPKRVMGHT